jgi:hypothetical protein
LPRRVTAPDLDDATFQRPSTPLTQRVHLSRDEPAPGPATRQKTNVQVAALTMRLACSGTVEA